MNTWIVFTAITLAYIIILVVYFIRRSKSHEKELKNFLDLAQNQLETHKHEASTEADRKVTQAMLVVKKVQQAAQAFEDEAKNEYDEIISDAKEERRQLLAQAKTEIETMFKKADQELLEYKASRHEEIEKNLVKLVVAVSEKVAQIHLTPKEHEEIIFKSLDEVKIKRSRA